MLVTSRSTIILSISLNVFNLITERNCHLTNTELVSCKYFAFGQTQISFLGIKLKFYDTCVSSVLNYRSLSNYKFLYQMKLKPNTEDK